MSQPESVPLDAQEETIGEVTYTPLRTLSELEKKYLYEFFSKNTENHKRGYTVFYYIFLPTTLLIYIYVILSGEMSYSDIFIVILFNAALYFGIDKLNQRAQSLSLGNPVVQMEGDFTYRSVSFSIIGSGLHIGGVSVGFPPGWGEAINFHQFTGHEVTAEVYATGNQRLILAIEGETYSGAHKRFTLEEALRSGQIEMEDARPS